MPDATADQVAAYLAEVWEREQAAAPGPWLTVARHGRDIADEGWSDVRVRDAGGRDVAITYLTNILEGDPSNEEATSEFIEESRSDVPRLLAAVAAVLALCDDPDTALLDIGDVRAAISTALLCKEDSDDR